MSHKIVFRPTPAENLKQLYLYIAEEAGHERGLSCRHRGSMYVAADILGARNGPRSYAAWSPHYSFELSAAIAFRVIGDTVEVLRILRHGQDIPYAWPGD